MSKWTEQCAPHACLGLLWGVPSRPWGCPGDRFLGQRVWDPLLTEVWSHNGSFTGRCMGLQAQDQPTVAVHGPQTDGVPSPRSPIPTPRPPIRLKKKFLTCFFAFHPRATLQTGCMRSRPPLLRVLLGVIGGHSPRYRPPNRGRIEMTSTGLRFPPPISRLVLDAAAGGEKGGGEMETWGGRWWMTVERRCAGSENRQTTPATTNTTPGANCWAPLTHKRHIPPHPAQPRYTNHWAPRVRKRHQQEHRLQRPTKCTDGKCQRQWHW